jgi:hypothetical protein
MAKQAKKSTGKMGGASSSKTAKAGKSSSKRGTREPWTKQDLSELKKHSKSKTAVSKIAKAMGRSEGALRQKAYALELALGHRR